MILSPLPFGGMAMEPETPEETDWLADLDGDVFRAPDACMEFSMAGSVGFEPRDVEGAVDSALAAGFVLKAG